MGQIGEFRTGGRVDRTTAHERSDEEGKGDTYAVEVARLNLVRRSDWLLPKGLAACS